MGEGSRDLSVLPAEFAALKKLEKLKILKSFDVVVNDDDTRRCPLAE